MKVFLVNGSPNEHGCTYTALSEAAKMLNENGIDTHFFLDRQKANIGLYQLL